MTDWQHNPLIVGIIMGFIFGVILGWYATVFYLCFFPCKALPRSRMERCWHRYWDWRYRGIPRDFKPVSRSKGRPF